MAKRTILALLVAAILGATLAAPSRSSAESAAEDCLSEPNGTPPQGSHWYYRTDRSTSRRCWYQAPQREKANKEAKEVVPSKPRTTTKPISQPKAEVPAEPIVRAPEPVRDIVTPLQSPPPTVAPIEPESAPARDQNVDAPSEAQPPQEESEQVEKPLITPVPAAADPADATSGITFEWMLALFAAALGFAAIIARKIFKALVVRRLRRRRSVLRTQWEAESATAIADMASTARQADVVGGAVAAARSTEMTRGPMGGRDRSRHEIAEHYVEDPDVEESLQRLLHSLRRRAA